MTVDPVRPAPLDALRETWRRLRTLGDPLFWQVFCSVLILATALAMGWFIR